MTATRAEESFSALQVIAASAGLRVDGAEPIRLAENDLWRLPGDVVVRITRVGQEHVAAREVAVAQWLERHRFPAVRPLAMDQPLLGAGRAATFWELLPPHDPGTEKDLAPLLRRLHNLPQPDFSIGHIYPFVRVAERIEASSFVSDDDRQWLLRRKDALREEWDLLPAGLPWCVVHGDAWGGNCAATASGAFLLDFERTAVGPPEWDLTSTAVAYDTFGTLSRGKYARFCDLYGHDVMSWDGYETLRDIRELRLVTFAMQAAGHDRRALQQARHRLDCIRGTQGPRPWNWEAVG